MLDRRFPISESQDIVVNLTFSTTVLTDGSGGEERNINWQSPILSYDLQQVLIRRQQLNEIIEFFKEARGAATAFRYRDWSDYRVTPQPKNTRYGSYTIGLLFPNADGVRSEFGLVKKYVVPNSVHLRGILLPDPDTVIIYDANLNPIPYTDWIFDLGKFVFSQPPPPGEMYVEAKFDVPVNFGSDEFDYRIKSTIEGNAFSIEGLQLEEKRKYPFTLLYDELDEIKAPFALANYFDSIAGVREQTEIIDLISGFDKRTARWGKLKRTFNLGKMPLRNEELEYLIAFFRCVKGKGQDWVLESGNKTEAVLVRFDDDSLSIRLKKQGRYESDGVRAIEIAEAATANTSFLNSIDRDTFVYVFIDTSGSMNASIPIINQAIEEFKTLLVDRVYGTVEAMNAKVSQNNSSNEQWVKIYSDYYQEKAVYLIWINEAEPVYHTSSVYSPPTAAYQQDLNNFLSSYDSRRNFRSFIYSIVFDNPAFSSFQNHLTAACDGTDGYSPALKNYKIEPKLDIPQDYTAEQYLLDLTE